MAKKPILFDDWLDNPTFESQLCHNQFHDMCDMMIHGKYSPLNPMDPPDMDSAEVKLALLLKAQLVIPEGDAIYIRDGENVHILGDAIDLLAYYMHTDTKHARKAADILETNFQGYFPVNRDLVQKDHIIIRNGDTVQTVNLRTLEVATDVQRPYVEYGISNVTTPEVQEALTRFFKLVNKAIGDEYFAERMLMYPFKQKIREKSHILVGAGGNGKSMFMRMVQVLYGDKAYTDAPQPKFSGHDAGVISYSLIGKKVVTFNDVDDPSAKFLEWMKRMITGNLEVKTPSGSWLSVPCQANFFMETNHEPQFLDLNAHARRFVVRTFDPSFKLAEEMEEEELDLIGERGNLTSADIVLYLMNMKEHVDDWTRF